MSQDLDRSVRLLEDVSTTSRGLLKNSLLKNKPSKRILSNISMTLTPEEMQYLQQEAGMNMSEFEHTMNSMFAGNQTVTGSVIQHEPWKASVDVLFMEFLEVLQTRSSGYDVLEIVSDLFRCCSDALNVLKSFKSKVNVNIVNEEEWLENERNTWQLVYILYQDRLSSLALQPEKKETVQYFGHSEKFCIQKLFQREQLVRESQLVIDWLESCASSRDDEALHFSDSTTGWENTLHELKFKEMMETTLTKKIVSSLDPDAQHYEKLPLHELDMEDEKKLCYKVYSLIRCGKLELAQQLCESCGHPWRAALYEGWRLHHDPNIKETLALPPAETMEVDNQENSIVKRVQDISDDESDTEDCMEKEAEPEGNPHRDVWKYMGWKYCEKDCLNKHEKAAMGAYCGHLKSLLTVANNWEDYLWAYMKVMVDIRVESEIRDYVNKKYIPLPEEYWNQKMSINEIFSCLETCKNSTVSNQANITEHVIQKLIILEEIDKLMSQVEEWLEESSVPTHFLRFLSHLLLFFEQIGQTQNREVIDKVLEAYIERLMEMNETQLVAFYVSKMGSHAQVQLYASYLEKITNNDDRKEALEYGDTCGLNIFAVTKRVVENIRNQPHSVTESGDLQERITEADEMKISALDWVLFYEEQRAEALVQSNAMIFTFLTLRKLDAAQLVFNKLPNNIIEYLLSEGEVSDTVNQTIKEHLSYKAYLDAQEAFSNWFKLFKSKPLPPMDLPDNAQFTEKVAHEHQVTQYKAEIERWKMSTSNLVKTAKALLYNVLLFPDGGWLNGAKDADFLRSNCIPECVLLLYSVLYESGSHEECVQLADIIASEKHCIYKVYTKEKLGEILMKLCESSIALLNEKKDPWGNETSA